MPDCTKRLMHRCTDLCQEAVVEVPLGQQEVILEGHQVGRQLCMHHCQLPQLSCHLHALHRHDKKPNRLHILATIKRPLSAVGETMPAMVC